MRVLVFLLAAISCAAGSMGCGYKRPFERPPGTLDQQRQEAAQHDPYADNDAGPEIVGGRPREFQRPDPMPERSRAHPASEFNYHRPWYSGWFGPLGR